MLSLQELLDIAMRHASAMSDALILACFEKAYELGVTLHAPTRAQARDMACGADWAPEDGTDYERMVCTNSDTRHNHV